MICGCTRDVLCDRCCDDSFAQLRGVAACRGDTWAQQVAVQRRRPYMPWPADSSRVRVLAVGWVKDLTRDERLRARLVDELIRQAARRWGELKPDVSGGL